MSTTAAAITEPDANAQKAAVAPTARTPGAHRAQPGEFAFDFKKLDRIMGGPGYSPVFGGCVEGDRMMVALMRAPAGEVSQPHSHPNEQWIYVLEGVMSLVVDGRTHTANPGDVLYIPANTVHCGSTPAGQDALFFTVKDTSHMLHGIKVPA